MKRLKVLAVAIALTLIVGTLAGCSGSKEIVIGFCGPLTGGSSFLGQTGEKAVQLAVDEVNAAGGIAGRKLKLVSYNDQAVPAEGLSAITKLIDQDGATAIVGPFNSSVTLAILDTVEKKQVPILTTAGNTKICNQGYKYVFRTSLDNEMQGVQLADFAVGELGYKKIAVLYPTDDFGTELKDFFVKTATPKGAEIVSAQGYAPATTDFYGILSGIKPLAPEAILLAGFVEDSSQILRQAKELGITAQFLGFGGLADDSLQQLAGDACEGLIMIALFEPVNPVNQVGKDFVVKYKAKYNEDANSYSGESYGSALHLIDALKRAKTLDGKGVRDALTQNSLDVPLGHMSFDERGQGVVQLVFSMIKGGKRVPYAP